MPHRVATWNIHRGRGVAGRFRPQRIAAVIAEIAPDLIALQEAQHYLRRTTPMLDAEAIARETGLEVLHVTQREQGWRSNMVLVRRGALVRRLPVGVRLGGLEPRGAVLAELDLGEGPFRLFATHLSLGARTRAAQARLLLAAAPDDLPTLLLGDLNEWRPHGSALTVLAPRFGVPPALATFPSFRPLLALDRILGDPPGMVGGLAVHDTKLARSASDHLPLMAWLDLPRGRRAG